MDIETVIYEVVNESATDIERGTILGLELTVLRETEFGDGSRTHTHFGVKFTCESGADPFRWEFTTNRSESSPATPHHIIATRDAAQFIEDEYGAGVQLDQL
jgi:hypothetical protein